MDLLAIMGRGIQRLRESDPVEDVNSWVLTEDWEVCGKDSAHLPVRVPADDENPYCMVGGGEMNQKAGSILILDHCPAITVCAYGDRSAYLKSVNGPSESEVMSSMLKGWIENEQETGYWQPHRVGYFGPEIIVWLRTRSLDGRSNTGQEILNIFDLAIERDLKTIGIVTIGVHIARTMTHVAEHLSRNRKYRHLTVQPFVSEEVLIAGHPLNWDRVQRLRASQAFARTWASEAAGIANIVLDKYGDAKPKVETTK